MKNSSLMLLMALAVGGASAQQAFDITGNRVTTTSEKGVHVIEDVKVTTPGDWVISAARGEQRATALTLEGVARIQEAGHGLVATATGVQLMPVSGALTADALVLANQETYTCRNGRLHANGKPAPVSSICPDTDGGGSMPSSCIDGRLKMEFKAEKCPSGQ